mmetsp:Transcript_38522/g.64821  ORF Transcript_38522/g.64821 Transcript_38522/m.64821 type:complete len:250 (-) Transcript_38522:1029-1778(-)
MTDKCYICKLDKSDTQPTDRKIRCIGQNLCIQLHGVHGHAELTLPETLRNKTKRAEASRCECAQGDRHFHPTCLGRQPKGAFAMHPYQHDKETDICSKLDQTHRLCDDCLTKWCADGAAVGKLASKEEPSSKEQMRGLDNKAYAARKREKHTLAKHAQLGDCKLLLSASRNGQNLPCMCPNVFGLWKKGADPEQTDPSLKKIEALYETIVTAWGAITQMWYGVNSSKRVPTGETKNSDEDAQDTGQQHV